MGQLWVTYVVLPGLSAATTAALVPGWRWAGLALVCAVAIFLALPGRIPPGMVFFPLVAGAGMAGAILTILYALRPGTGRTVRAALAAGPTLALGLWIILANPGLA